MEILFENKYERNLEWAKQTYRCIYLRRQFIIFCCIYLFAALLWGLYELIFNGYINILIIVIPILFAVVFWRYKSSVKITLQRDIETFGKPVEVTVNVTNEAIMQINSLGGNYCLKFHNIKKAVRTKKYVYIITNAKLIYTFKNDGFTVGDKDHFLDFLRMKGIKVK